MGEVVRLLGLTQDGALVPYLVGGLLVWATMSVRALNTAVAQLRDDHQAMDKTLKDVANDIASLREDVGFLRGKVDTRSA